MWFVSRGVVLGEEGSGSQIRWIASREGGGGASVSWDIFLKAAVGKGGAVSWVSEWKAEELANRLDGGLVRMLNGADLITRPHKQWVGSDAKTFWIARRMVTETPERGDLWQLMMMQFEKSLGRANVMVTAR